MKTNVSRIYIYLGGQQEGGHHEEDFFGGGDQGGEQAQYQHANDYDAFGGAPADQGFGQNENQGQAGGDEYDDFFAGNQGGSQPQGLIKKNERFLTCH